MLARTLKTGKLTRVPVQPWTESTASRALAKLVTGYACVGQASCALNDGHRADKAPVRPWKAESITPSTRLLRKSKLDIRDALPA